MIQAIDDIIPSYPMPKAHDQKDWRGGFGVWRAVYGTERNVRQHVLPS